jgi:hypothetical protein
VLFPVRKPRERLRVREALFRFFDRAAADAGEDELVPDLVGDR